MYQVKETIALYFVNFLKYFCVPQKTLRYTALMEKQVDLAIYKNNVTDNNLTNNQVTQTQKDAWVHKRT